VTGFFCPKSSSLLPEKNNSEKKKNHEGKKKNPLFLLFFLYVIGFFHFLKAQETAVSLELTRRWATQQATDSRGWH